MRQKRQRGDVYAFRVANHYCFTRILTLHKLIGSRNERILDCLSNFSSSLAFLSVVALCSSHRWRTPWAESREAWKILISPPDSWPEFMHIWFSTTSNPIRWRTGVRRCAISSTLGLAVSVCWFTGCTRKDAGDDHSLEQLVEAD